jgi:solute carrier family 29 (equilibrative nucleoside transporter), member 1/2/3
MDSIVHSFTYSVIQSIFPPITTSIQSTNPNLHPLIFSALHFFVFNVADFLGRYVCSFSQFLIWDPRKILFMSLARTLFIPLFLMCNIQYSSPPSTTHAIISSDLAFFLILFAFGLSHGYGTSLCMMGAPNLEHNPRLMGRREDVDLAATIASFSIIIGLSLGSFLSFGVRAIHCGCNPFISSP